MTEPKGPRLAIAVEQGILVLTILERDVEGDEIAQALRQEMLEALATHPTKNVLVDFCHTEYLSSAAFWPLLSLYRQLQAIGGRLTVCGLSPTVGDVFYTTRLVSPDGSFAAPFGLETDVATAVARIAKAATTP